MVTWPDLADAAPLHLSDLVGLSAAYALWARRQWAFALTYYWGLLLSIQALVSPILRGPDFPARDFLVFWTTTCLSSRRPSISPGVCGCVLAGATTAAPSR